MKDNIDFWQDALVNQPQSFKDWFVREKAFLGENIKRGSSVLDVGCGTGRSISDIVDITENITGSDHDQKAIDRATKNFSGHPSISLLVSNATNLPFGDERFDYVICMSTFVNFADDKYIALAEMKRVLKRKGKIIISVYSEEALPDRMRNYRKIGLKIKSVDKGTVLFGEDFMDNVSEQCSRSELLDIFSNVNLRVEKLEKVKIAYLVVLSKVQ